jgi:rhamnulose-1-phosphate aldolase
MMSHSIISAPFIAGMVRATTDMWLKGWDERNGGNVSMRLTDADIAPWLRALGAPRLLPLTEKLPELGGQYYVVTGTGKYFRNVQLEPETTLGLIRITPDGAAMQVLWGYKDGGAPTSELSAHLKSHRTRQAASAGRDRVVAHCHATNLIALSYVLGTTSAVFTRALWEMSTECLVVFPDGVGVLPWMVPGTDGIGEATAEQMRRHRLVLWPFHGVFGVGASLDEAFGLIDTAEKAAEVLVKVLSMGGKRRSITTQELRDLAQRFGVTPMADALAAEHWAP